MATMTEGPGSTRTEPPHDLDARYATAESMQAYAMKRLIPSFNVVPGWIGDTDVFWYRNQTTSGHEFVLVDPSARTRRPAFDHARLAAELAVVTEQDVDPQKLPFSAIEPRDGAVRFVVIATNYCTILAVSGAPALCQTCGLLSGNAAQRAVPRPTAQRTGRGQTDSGVKD